MEVLASTGVLQKYLKYLVFNYYMKILQSIFTGEKSLKYIKSVKPELTTASKWRLPDITTTILRSHLELLLQKWPVMTCKQQALFRGPIY